MTGSDFTAPAAAGDPTDRTDPKADPTTDPALNSFVETPANSHFPIQNLPWGVFRPRPDAAPRVGVAIGREILDLSVLADHDLLGEDGADAGVFRAGSLNPLMRLGPEAWRRVRLAVSRLLRDDEPRLRDDRPLRREALIAMADATLQLPCEVGDYTDFYSSREHAANVGALLRGPDNALPPNWLHLPIAYHGRASSIILSGQDLRRPRGQQLRGQPPAGGQPQPIFGPSQAVDFELEMGCVIGTGNPLGQPIDLEQAERHVFGWVLVNDWSARDLQKWEYAPLGPFLSKSFATSISPWVVSPQALAPFATAAPQQDLPPLPYLSDSRRRTYDVRLEVQLQPAGDEARTICRSNLRHLYWTVAQQIAHHTVAGCNLRPGDLLGTGTISGPDPDSRGCLLELTEGGRQPLRFPNCQRRFLEDGDRVTIAGWCQAKRYRVGFGEVTAQLLPSLDES